MSQTVVEVEDLRIELSAVRALAVDGVSFALREGEILGLVGESGSGKTTTANSLLGYARRGARIVGGTVKVDGRDILSSSPAELRALRGTTVGYVPQDPGTALNPALRIGQQLRETFTVHGAAREAEERIRSVLAEVKLPSDRAFLQRYPHQLSGGQQQRVCLALAFSLRPRVLVLDEPTTGLDVTTQSHILETVRALCREHRVAALYVTHDLAVVAELTDRVMVMYAGRVCEIGPRAEVIRAPAHPYTRTLLQATPDVGGARRLSVLPGATPPVGERHPTGCEFAGRCPVAIDVCRAEAPPMAVMAPDHVARCHRRPDAYAIERAPDDALAANQIAEEPVVSVSSVQAFHGGSPVVKGVSLEVRRNECLALVGESGSGKTTLARTIVGLHASRTGEIRFGDEVLERAAKDRSDRAQREIQYVFQSPYRSLNPRKTIGRSIESPIRRFRSERGEAARRVAGDYLERVSMPRTTLDRLPHELSGGERQRVAIARALICEPELLICDEITSALDVSVQAAIIELLRELRAEHGLSMLFITHNLALVRSIADGVVVMKDGSVVESGPVGAVLDAPQSDYARALLDDTPALTVA